jgi:hypothetical protein
MRHPVFLGSSSQAKTRAGGSGIVMVSSRLRSALMAGPGSGLEPAARISGVGQQPGA